MDSKKRFLWKRHEASSIKWRRYDDDCVVHAHAVPPEELKRYSATRDLDAEQGIAWYVEGQARDEAVLHVERIKTEYVLGEAYEIWDVTTDKHRWWVITNLTNLYSQKHFPSLDYTISFHIGLMARLRSRSTLGNNESEASPFVEVMRRLEQAGDRQERAVEAEDYQAVGMQLRECLISLVSTTRKMVVLPSGIVKPQDANFVEWSRILAEHFCPGGTNKEIRSYLKATAEKVWTLVNWLTHHRNATDTSTSIAVNACSVLIMHYGKLLHNKDIYAICDNCLSRNLRTHYDINIKPDGDYYTTCGSCGWSDHPSSL